MDIKDFDKDLPSTTKDIPLEITGSITKRRFVGEFTCKIPNIDDQIMIAKAEANSNGQYPMYLESGVLKANKMLAYLKYTLVGPYPKFWQESNLGRQLRDLNVIEELYNKVIEFENEWTEKLWSEPKEEVTISKGENESDSTGSEEG